MNYRPVTLIPWSLHKPNGDHRNKTTGTRCQPRRHYVGPSPRAFEIAAAIRTHMTNHLSAQHCYALQSLDGRGKQSTIFDTTYHGR